MAPLAYDAAKAAARFPNPKGAHDELTDAAHRAQADALEIETQATSGGCPVKSRAGSPRPANRVPTVTADLADALARQYCQEAERVRGPSAAEGGALAQPVP